METLIVVLALCALAYAGCPKMYDPITQENINSVETVAYITVTGKTGKVYNLQYWRYYDVPKPAPPQWESLGTLVLPECELDVDTEYVLGCNGGNDCKFMRRYDIITHAELKLLEKK
ncbi:hypothetical protein Aduo_010088 [Ancylostoma duodenale]